MADLNLNLLLCYHYAPSTHGATQLFQCSASLKLLPKTSQSALNVFFNASNPVYSCLRLFLSRFVVCLFWRPSCLHPSAQHAQSILAITVVALFPVFFSRVHYLISSFVTSSIVILLPVSSKSAFVQARMFFNWNFFTSQFSHLNLPSAMFTQMFSRRADCTTVIYRTNSFVFSRTKI